MPELTTQEQGRKRRRGIFLLPNLFTTAALFAGFYAIVAAMNSRFEPAAIAIFVAMVLDGMDGRIARMTNTQSAFGAEYDSLSDMIAFGLAPALVVYQWMLQALGKIGWLAAFVFTAAAALRLARFNTQVGSADKRYFQGLPSPAAAAVLAGTVWLGTSLEVVRNASLALAVTVLTVTVALLMVSNIRYHSFKDLDLRGRVPFVTILTIVLAFVFVSLHPALVLFSGFSLYACYGPVTTALERRRRRQLRRSTPAPEADDR
ncbi:MAG: CDP-diacylglycerol--serine O-phosphatidyltransferase [Gammaproteobacteria bacterium]|nr:CDP-diacylglycerol--serine O-phosphatidyltransferase [Gammaproteobacteria bacterium]